MGPKKPKSRRGSRVPPLAVWTFLSTSTALGPTKRLVAVWPEVEPTAVPTTGSSLELLMVVVLLFPGLILPTSIWCSNGNEGRVVRRIRQEDDAEVLIA